MFNLGAKIIIKVWIFKIILAGKRGRLLLLLAQLISNFIVIEVVFVVGKVWRRLRFNFVLPVVGLQHILLLICDLDHLVVLVIRIYLLINLLNLIWVVPLFRLRLILTSLLRWSKLLIK